MKDRIIELENGTMLYVLERETYQNKNYILGEYQQKILIPITI